MRSSAFMTWKQYCCNRNSFCRRWMKAPSVTNDSPWPHRKSFISGSLILTSFMKWQSQKWLILITIIRAILRKNSLINGYICQSLYVTIKSLSIDAYDDWLLLTNAARLWRSNESREGENVENVEANKFEFRSLSLSYFADLRFGSCFLLKIDFIQAQFLTSF